MMCSSASPGLNKIRRSQRTLDKDMLLSTPRRPSALVYRMVASPSDWFNDSDSKPLSPAKPIPTILQPKNLYQAFCSGETVTEVEPRPQITLADEHQKELFSSHKPNAPPDYTDLPPLQSKVAQNAPDIHINEEEPAKIAAVGITETPKV